MLERLYTKWGIDDNTEVQSIQPEDFPTLSDLYDQIEEVYQSYDSEEDPLYTRDLLREILLGLHSMCRGAESKFSMDTPTSPVPASWSSVSKVCSRPTAV